MADAAKDLVEKVRDWLKNQGQHLEFQVAERFARAEFGIKQGVHVRSSAEKSREVDVFAFRVVVSEGLVAGFAVVIECKYSREKPWVIFSNPYGVLDDEDTLQSLLGSAAWRRSAPELVAKFPDLLDSPIIGRTTRHAFGGRQVFCNNQSDVVYAALQGVVGNAREGLREIDEPDEDGTTHAWVFLPIVVVDAPLVEAFWDESKGDIAIEERESVRLHWSGSHATDDDVAVDVVCASALDHYVGQLRAAVDPFLQRLHHVAHEGLSRDLAPPSASARSEPASE